MESSKDDRRDAGGGAKDSTLRQRRSAKNAGGDEGLDDRDKRTRRGSRGVLQDPVRVQAETMPADEPQSGETLWGIKMKRIRKVLLQTLVRRNGYRRCHNNTFVIRTKMFGDVYFEINQTGQARIK